jgi:hypothetical protein
MSNNMGKCCQIGYRGKCSQIRYFGQEFKADSMNPSNRL